MIPDLPPLYIDHLVEPRGQQDLPQPEAEGTLGSVVGGMGIRVTLAWRPGHNSEPLIRAAGVRVFSSVSALAPASYLSEYVVGLTPEAAQGIEARDLLEGLGGRHARHVLPAAVRRGAECAVGALHCALGLPGHRPADPEGDGILVCRCLTVGDRAIRQAIREGARSPESIGEACGAGTGCRSCRPELLVQIDEETAGRLPPPPEHLAPIARIAMALAGSVLRAQGQPLCDVRVTNEGIALHLGRALPDACLSPRGARAMVRQMLRDTVGDGIEVSLA